MGSRVAVVGVGVTKFGIRANVGWKELVCEAMYEAFGNVNMDPKEIEMGFAACSSPNTIDQLPVGSCVAEYAGLAPLGMWSTAEQCASSQVAIINGVLAIRSGLYDKVLIIGFDKMTDGFNLRTTSNQHLDMEYEATIGFASYVALWYKRHLRAHGEPTREQVAMYAVHARRMAKRNPKAYYCDAPDITVEDVLKAPMVASPLGALDRTSFFVDGAAAMILVKEEIARKYTDTPVYIDGVSCKNDHIYEWMDPSSPMYPVLRLASRESYKMARIEAKDIDFACLHDCWAFYGINQLECLDICEDGTAGEFVEEEQMALGGKCPCATDGGIFGRGHPPGASGIADGIEAVIQLRGEAGDRQVKGAEIGVVPCIGESSRTVCVYRR